MSLRRITALAAAALVAATGLAFAPAAHAASSVTIACEGDSKSTSVAVGDTLTINVSSCSIQSTSGVGTFTPATGYAQSTIQFTSPTVGVATLTIYAAGVNPSVLTINVVSASTGGGVPTAATLPGPPTNIVATAGNGAVQLTWSPPTSMGAGDFLEYGFNFQPTSTQGETYGCKTTRTTCTIAGLTNGQSYTLIGYTLSTIGWSLSARAYATPTASATCTHLTADVSPSGATVVTSPVGAGTTIATMPYIAVPYGGNVKTAALGTFAPATGFGAMGGDYATVFPQINGTCPIKVAVADGALLSLTVPSTPTGGAREISVNAGDPVYVWGVKTGVYDVTLTAGNLTAQPQVKVGTLKNAAYTITATPMSTRITEGGGSTVDFVVTDAFGNPVPGVELDMSASGQVSLPGNTSTGKATTDSNGKVTQTYVAASSAGNGTIRATGDSSNGALAWATDYVAPDGSPFTKAPQSAAEAAITVTLARCSPTSSAHDWHDCDLSGASLKGLFLQNGNFTGTNFTGADLSGSDFRKATCLGANFTKANLSSTDFRSSNIRNANFTNANLSYADLRSATNGGATFTGANLDGADMRSLRP